MNLFEVVKASINTQEAHRKQRRRMELTSTTMAWHCVRSIMTVARACMYRMTTTTVSPAGNTGM